MIIDMKDGVYMSYYLKVLAGLFFPRKCSNCLVVFDEGEYNWICERCMAGLSAGGMGPGCGICGKPFSIDFQTSSYLCGDCSSGPPPYDLLRSIRGYDGVFKELIHDFKYHKLPGLGKDLGKLLISFMQKSGFPMDFDLLIPVPVHKKKLVERGYDPPFLLAENLAREFHVPISIKCLVKAKRTAPQVSLRRKERLQNLKGAFALAGDGGAARGKRVLLLDDVLTTGATMRECSLVLKEGGADRVYGVTLARA
ncbi:MAG: ComF family protein [Nitrospinae bacterium]|nr:ComF family protein [Nitrospinota bacterium]